MKKLLLVITVILVLAGLFFASPIMGRDKNGENTYYGSAYAGEGGGGGFWFAIIYKIWG